MSKSFIYIIGFIIGFGYPITGVLTDSVHPHSGISYFIGADGHKITLMHNDSAIDPTYDQLLNFIASDTTSQIPYKSGQFTCGDYAERVQNNAEKAGILCGWVSVDFLSGAGHACNAFNTTDKGIVFIDCTNGDAHVDMYIGRWYAPTPIDKNPTYSIKPLGILKNYEIYW
jgi:hypothetical protein